MKNTITWMTAALFLLGPVSAQSADRPAELQGAGSTLAEPLMRAWADEYQPYRVRQIGQQASAGQPVPTLPGRALAYEAVGSSTGLERLKAGQTDYAVSEQPLASAALRQARLRQIPVAVSGIAVVANLPGRLAVKLSGPVLASIYLGTVRTWNDPSIARLNPGVTLPSQAIVPVYRSEGSGSTFAFSSYLSVVSPTWKTKLGQGTTLNWPVGTGVRGSNAVRDIVTLTPYSLGYVSDVVARRARMNIVPLVNAAGKAVTPDLVTLNAAAARAVWQPKTDFVESLVNLPGEQSYPITTAIYYLYPDRTHSAHQRAAAFAKWAVREGATTVRKLGYLPLPANKLKIVDTYLNE